MEILKKIFNASKREFKTRIKKFRRNLRGTNKIVMPPVTSESMKIFFREARLKILDVGTRGGVLSQFNMLAPFSEIFICESDAGEARRVEAKLTERGHFLKVTNIRESLHSIEGLQPFFKAKNPAASSFMEPDHAFINNFYDGEPDKLKDTFEIVAKPEISAITLDHAAEKYGANDISIIKLDTQGTELDILKSGATVLNSVVCIYLEVEFLPFYKNQPLFSDINNFLESQGFRIFGMKNSFAKRRTKAKAAASADELLGTHALYFREKNRDGSDLNHIQKIRLICAASAFGYLDYSIWLLEQADLQEYLKSRNLSGLQDEFASYSYSAERQLKRGP